MRDIHLDYNWRKTYAIFEPGIAWANHEASHFWLDLRAEKLQVETVDHHRGCQRRFHDLA